MHEKEYLQGAGHLIEIDEGRRAGARVDTSEGIFPLFSTATMCAQRRTSVLLHNRRTRAWPVAVEEVLCHPTLRGAS